jgi:hypothetical protein
MGGNGLDFAWPALAQGLYFAATGLWSLTGIQSFQKVTGPKTDLWLVRTVGTLVLVIGAVLLLAAGRRVASAEVAALGLGSAVGLTAVDVVYVGKKRISRIYLLDAALEILFVVGWMVAGFGGGRPS